MSKFELAERIIELRDQAELTQEAAAKKAGVGVTTWSNIETGAITRPHSRTLIKMARALEVPVEQLLGVSNTTNLRSEASEVLDKARANLALLQQYMEHPPDEATWDAALEEHLEVMVEPLRLVNLLLDQDSPDRALIRSLVDATREHLEIATQIDAFNDLQYGHRHRAAG